MNQETYMTEEPVTVDDTIVRLIGIPFFGLVIPSATGLVNRANDSLLLITGCYAYCILLAFVIWQGNRFLLFRYYYEAFYKDNSALKKYLLIASLNIFYTAPVTLLLLFAWKYIVPGNSITNESIFLTMVINVVCVIFVTNIYEKVLFAKHSERDKLRFEKLEKAKIYAELEALKNQIDPHFMFNALNTISYLIDHHIPKAQLFIENLAEVYRYILRCKDKDLVMLRDEVDFMMAYASLMTLRYENSFSVQMDITAQQQSAFLIPPVSLMVAAENAVKHNELSQTSKLNLQLHVSGNMLEITNKTVPRKSEKESTKTGLENVNERFLRTTGQSTQVIQENGVFILRLPLLKLQNG